MCVDVGAFKSCPQSWAHQVGDGQGDQGETMATTKLQPLRFGDFLIERKLLDEGQLLDALAEHWMSGCAIGESVVRRGYLTQEQLFEQLRAYESLATVYI
jgi:hypothetical protein